MNRPLKPCNYFGCKNLVYAGYCKVHDKKIHIDKLTNEKNFRPSARQRGYDSNWEKFRRYYLRRNPVCAKCKQVPSKIPHHIVPLSKGGRKYDENNLIPVCVRCHNIIHHKKQ